MLRTLLSLGVLMGAETCAFMASTPMTEGEDCYPVVDTEDGSGVFTTPIYAGAGGGDIEHGVEVGYLSAEVEGDYLKVTYTITAEGIYLDEIHFWIGTDIYDAPLTDSEHGGAAFGHFPYKDEGIYDTSYPVYVPLEELGFSCPGDDADFVAIAHSALVECTEWEGDECTHFAEYETAIAYGTDLPDTERWGWYFDLTLTCTCEPGDEPEETCETAFAYDEEYAMCFRDLDLDEDGEDDYARWGWTNGALEEGDYEFVMRAGAAHCENGEEVGTLTVSYWEGVFSYEYTAYEGFEFAETQTYAGSDVLPVVRRGRGAAYTLAPGQYYIEDPLEGDIYVIGHAVVCGEFDEDYEDWDEDED